jgi:hypothetical protein
MVQDVYNSKKVLLVGFNSAFDNMQPVTIYNHIESRRGLNEIKPYFRLLSDLTKEIEHNGEKFIPLYELNKMRGVTTELSNYVFEVVEDNWFQCTWSDNTEFSFEKNTMSFYDITSSGISPQLEMFQKLFEWHFDVFGLIEKGLAISYNDLKN